MIRAMGATLADAELADVDACDRQIQLETRIDRCVDVYERRLKMLLPSLTKREADRLYRFYYPLPRDLTALVRIERKLGIEWRGLTERQRKACRDEAWKVCGYGRRGRD